MTKTVELGAELQLPILLQPALTKSDHKVHEGHCLPLCLCVEVPRLDEGVLKSKGNGLNYVAIRDIACDEVMKAVLFED